ncbi:MAG: MerR family transcriptional regulator [Chloroflexota bacterium]|nr:MerR family transcriptional regulator [Chloroflexota bacterium]
MRDAPPEIPRDLMPIGKFAAMCRLSLRALRLYDEQGVLRPALVDADSGYRYYRLDQAQDALLVRLLRALDVPLEEIRRIQCAVRDGAPDAARARLEDFWAHAEARRNEQRRILAYLHRLLQPSRREEAMSYPVKVKEVPAQHVVSQTSHVYVKDLEGFLRSSLDALAEHVQRVGGRQSGAPLAIYHGKVDEESDGPVQVCLPVAAPAVAGDATASDQLPAGPVAYTPLTYSQAEFPDILSAYQAVATWARQHGHDLAGSPREYYLVPPKEQTGTPEQVIMEIHWPLR